MSAALRLQQLKIEMARLNHEKKRLQKIEWAQRRQDRELLGRARDGAFAVYVMTGNHLEPSRVFVKMKYPALAGVNTPSEDELAMRLLDTDEVTIQSLRRGEKPAGWAAGLFSQVVKFLDELDLWNEVKKLNEVKGIAVPGRMAAEVVRRTGSRSEVFGPRPPDALRVGSFKKRLYRWKRHWRVSRGCVRPGERVPVQTMRDKALCARACARTVYTPPPPLRKRCAI